MLVGLSQAPDEHQSLFHSVRESCLQRAELGQVARGLGSRAATLSWELLGQVILPFRVSVSREPGDQPKVLACGESNDLYYVLRLCRKIIFTSKKMQCNLPSS